MLSSCYLLGAQVHRSTVAIGGVEPLLRLLVTGVRHEWVLMVYESEGRGLGAVKAKSRSRAKLSQGSADDRSN